MRIVAVALSLILPGLGHLAVKPRRAFFSPLRGILLSFGFILFVMAAVYRGFTVQGEVLRDWVFLSSAALAIGIYVGAVLDIAFAPRDLPESKREERDGHFKRGVVFYLQNELDDALREFKAALKLDRYDVESRLHLAMVYKAMGRKRKARRELKRCFAFDVEDKWRTEVTEELERVGR